MSGRPDPERVVPGLAAVLRRQEGLVRRVQLRALGLDDRDVARHIAAGRWQLVAPEVISADNGRLDLAQARWRAVLHAPRGWIAGRSALDVLGLSGHAPETVHVLVPRDSRPAPLPGARFHVTARLDGLDPSLRRGLPLTSAERAVVDGAAWSAHPRLAAGLAVAAVQQRLVRADDVLDELDRAGRVRHKVAVRDALTEAARGSESLAEIDLLPLLRRAGVTHVRRQVTAGSRRHDLEVDLADGRVLVIEVDGPSHQDSLARWNDSERDADTIADGQVVLRIPWFAARTDPAGVVRRIRRIVDEARRRAAD